MYKMRLIQICNHIDWKKNVKAVACELKWANGKIAPPPRPKRNPNLIKIPKVVEPTNKKMFFFIKP